MKRHAMLVPLLLGVALAQGQGPLSLNLSMALVRAAPGAAEKYVPTPKSVAPGDVLSQVVTVRNTGALALRNVPVRLPVPASTRYLAPERGMNVARTEYSIDGGKTFAPAPLKKTVTVLENGKSVRKEVEVRPSEYTAVRWVVAQVAAGQSLKFGYRVQVK